MGSRDTLTDPSRPELSRRLQEADSELARLARCEAQLKLRTGELLDALFDRGGHFELGFSSFEAYVVERCQRSRSWGRETRGLARRLRERGLKGVRRAMLFGRLGWSMAELLSRHATAENEPALLEEASCRTVRGMQAMLTGKELAPVREEESETDLMVRPTRASSVHELIMLAASRMLVEHLTGRPAGDENLVTALLGEGETNLLAAAEKRATAISFRTLDVDDLKESLLRMHDRRKARRRSRGGPIAPAPVVVEPLEDQGMPTSLRGLDREIRRCCQAIASRNIEMGRLARTLFFERAWRTLGYESPGHYASERIGVSLSSLEHKITLARRLARYPAIREAVNDGVIGYEAAQLIGRVVGRWAMNDLVKSWIDRARFRTIKHLKEEVGAVMLVVTIDPSVSRSPPEEDDVKAVFDFERKVRSGKVLRSYFESALPGPRTALTFAASPAEEIAAHATLRLTLSADLYAHWCNVEAQFRALAGRDASFVGFLCTSLWAAWLPYIEECLEKWKHIYDRDRWTCASPVCDRHDVTPHHVDPRSRGGTDAPGNVTAACALCHLENIHGGRLKVDGDTSKLTWLIGRDPILKVVGRDKIVLAA